MDFIHSRKRFRVLQVDFSRSTDSDFWDPPICEDTDDYPDFRGYLAENWVRSDFYDGYGLFDVMEEDSLNDKACAQVRKIMFSTAKANLKEVGEEITLLQSKLSWADEVWSKKLSTLKEMMNSLEVLIQRLKDEEQQRDHDLDFHFQSLEEQQTEDELDSHLQSLGEHSEKLNKMLKDLLDSYSPNIDVQVQSLSPAIEKLETNQFNKETKLSDSVATAYGAKTLEETVVPSCKSHETRSQLGSSEIGEATRSDLIKSCSTHAANVPVHLNIDSSNIHMDQETENQDSTTKAEKGVASTKVDKEAKAAKANTSLLALTWEAGSEGVKEDSNLSQEKTRGTIVKSLIIESISLELSKNLRKQLLLKQICEESALKRKLMMQEDARGTNVINTGKQVEAPGKTTAESPPKENQKESLISKSKVSDLDLALGETLKEPVNKKGENRNANLITLSGHAGGLQSRYNKGTDLNLKKDDGNSSIVDDYLGSAFQSLGKRMNCEAFPETKIHVELKKSRVYSKIGEDIMSISVKEEDEVTSRVAFLLPSKFSPTSTTTEDYISMSVAQLKAIAKERNLKRYSKLNKRKLIELLK
ncbi:OLC1v1036706C1 [Oldenlandia corymbosa var. corymbosa]|uniref:OLC1v1036706C1 n=1 Tax=Oldenlandia corymbosa var. corymbosa TaxID=529605 RepID=A0AAV1CY08_OLDCO|nr:OLC1v1036706C1 [Oldenlandia corymbosa var. corymbosa]